MTADVLKNYKRQIESWEMIPSDGGKFEVSLDDRSIFSKLAEKRFPTNEEVIGLIEKELAAAG